MKSSDSNWNWETTPSTSSTWSTWWKTYASTLARDTRPNSSRNSSTSRKCIQRFRTGQICCRFVLFWLWHLSMPRWKLPFHLGTIRKLVPNRWNHPEPRSKKSRASKRGRLNPWWLTNPSIMTTSDKRSCPNTCSWWSHLKSSSTTKPITKIKIWRLKSSWPMNSVSTNPKITEKWSALNSVST